jgi:hypothetical protein
VIAKHPRVLLKMKRGGPAAPYRFPLSAVAVRDIASFQ